ncbi:unnamed protein product [Clonostachys solani]|uniref:Uncharacterized protein n=1 Tax=Clonostachys solani TaxID=160281 RepID=A0A9N9ZFR7_9HYPO|nr:unnamed protein product [Clonostachys solani]
MPYARFPGAESTAPAYRALCSQGYAVGWETTYDIAVNLTTRTGMHGKVKVRKTPNNHWTRTNGLSWGRRWWNRWGTAGINYTTYQGIGPEKANARIV